MASPVQKILTRLEDQIRSGGPFEDLETDGVEIKPVPADGAQWREIHKTVCAFLNTRGGILILGVKEEGAGEARRYVFKGYHPEAEPKLKEFPRLFTERDGSPMELEDRFPAPDLQPFLDGQVALVFVDELPADRKFCFLKGNAYRRILTGDHKISEGEIERQEAYREEAIHARELLPVPEAKLEDLSLDALNHYIMRLNQSVKVETIKTSLSGAARLLERKGFYRDGKVTTLGMLVCGAHPEDFLGFRARLHCHVEAPGEIARDKRDFAGNVSDLMESGIGFVWRNIHVGIRAEGGGTAAPEYPEELIRETINNALAHRDYSINQPVIVSIVPGRRLEIRNPGGFRKEFIVSSKSDPELRRIVPAARARNPKLAEALGIFRRWEGKGIGMATLVNLCLENRTGLPHYVLGRDEVRLFLSPGRLLDEDMERRLGSHDAHIERKLNGRPPTEQQKLVLAYFIRSEEANARHYYTILLTPDNNHYSEIESLLEAGLIHRHPDFSETAPVYRVDPVLTRRNHRDELRALFGEAAFDSLPPFHQDVLDVIYRNSRFSKTPASSANRTSLILLPVHKPEEPDRIKRFESLKRKVRLAFERLESANFIRQADPAAGKRAGYVLNESRRDQSFL